MDNEFKSLKIKVYSKPFSIESKPLGFQLESSCLDAFNCEDQPWFQLDCTALALFSIAWLSGIVISKQEIHFSLVVQTIYDNINFWKTTSILQENERQS